MKKHANQPFVRRWACLVFLLLSLGAEGGVFPGPRARVLAEPPLPLEDRWEKEIAAFEQAEMDSPSPPGAIVFVGSSSIKNWDLAKAFPGRHCLNRGFGGSTFRDLCDYAPRLLKTPRPSVLVIYSGDNDLANDANPDQVVRDFSELIAWYEQEHPETWVVVLSIKPSASRWQWLEQQRKVNREIEAICRSKPRLRFVDVASCLLTEKGCPNPELFKDDRLHLSEAGYQLWHERLAKVLEELEAVETEETSHQR